MTSTLTPIAPPSAWRSVGEVRAIAQAAAMLPHWAQARWRKRSCAESFASALVVPGFGADDRWTRPMRDALEAGGVRTKGWGLGRNLAGLDLRHRASDVPARWGASWPTPYRGEAAVPMLCERLIPVVLEAHRREGRPLLLVGWSLGGYLAREVAREHPEAVLGVVTIGSPVVGGPKYTRAAAMYRRRGVDVDWIERAIRERESRPIAVPMLSLYSGSDGVVAPAASIDHHSPAILHQRVGGSHIGLVFSSSVWSATLSFARRVSRTPH
ncbi:alpha/beta fold hydrolase [Silanimonas algicola]